MFTKGWASTTSAFDRSIWWPVGHVCSAKQMQPHPHSKVPYTLGNSSRGSNTPLLPVGLVVQGPWG